MENIIRFLFCPNCGWKSDDNDIGMKPECPDCKNPLNYISGTKEEIEKHMAKKYPQFVKEFGN